ncbi:hypothetical protein [Halococcoides cellulosivorans]|uniref:DUF8149 domain-containing protein n=1 Tax=Halococcoides cellulosivorans TaxID=1679096 RepID=A0A2R4X0F8_9EURY|nr:hypothetical protein [Halococcoides cellulosivorans]AWB27284.1 hypothetical protein HARCEL1_05995 [Halococcoides cellulosivorans]
MGDAPTVPVVCTACDTTTRVPLDDLEATIAGHNDRLHDGDPIAEVDPAITEALADLVAQDVVFDDD